MRQYVSIGRLSLLFGAAFLIISILWNPVAISASEPIFSELCYAIADERIVEGGEEDSSDTLVGLYKYTGETVTIGQTSTEKIEAIAFGPDGTLYAANGEVFGRVDIQTGQFTPIGIFGLGKGPAGFQYFNDVDGLTYDVKSGHMYAIQRRSHAPDLLFQIDLEATEPQNGMFVQGAFEHEFFPGIGADYLEIQPTNDLDDIDDIAISPRTGHLVGAINRGGTGGLLIEIDPQLASTRVIGSFIHAATGDIVDDIEGLAFFNDGILYGSTGDNGPDVNDSNKLFQIELNVDDSSILPSGTAHEVGVFPVGTMDIEALGCLTEPAFIQLEKLTNGPGQTPMDGPMIDMGNTITWTYHIFNTGSVALTNISLTDDNGTPADLSDDFVVNANNCPALQAPLIPGDNTTCTATGIAITDWYTNTAVVIGDPVDGQPSVTDTDPSSYFGITTFVSMPDIELEKLTNGPGQTPIDGATITPGDPVVWTYHITNTGNIALVNILLQDDNGTPGDPNDDFQIDATSCPALQMPLAPEASVTCTATGVAIVGHYANMATVTGDPEDGSSSVTDDDPSSYFGPLPAIELEKLTNGPGQTPMDGAYIAMGDPVVWTYHITNTGNVSLTDIVVADDNGTLDDVSDDFVVDANSCLVLQVPLLPGNSVICTASGIATSNWYTNTATVTGFPTNGGSSVTDDDPSSYFGLKPAIDLEKATNGEDADVEPGPSVKVGSVVTWSYVIHNVGNVDLEDITLFDDRLGFITPDCPQTYLAVDEKITCFVEGIAIAGQYKNNGIVNGDMVTDGSYPSQTVTDEDPSHYIGHTTSTPDPLPEPASVGNFVWYDANRDGLQTPNESGVADVKVVLFDAETNTLVDETTTDENGQYLFNGYYDGEYYLAFTLPDNFATFTSQNADPNGDDHVDSDVDPATGQTMPFMLRPGDNDLRWDAGLLSAGVGDRVWDDTPLEGSEYNGIQDPNEPGIAGVVVVLYNAATHEVVQQTTTDTGGYYFISVLNSGEYYLEFILPQQQGVSKSLHFTSVTNPDQGDDDNLDSDANLYVTGAAESPLDISGRTEVFSITNQIDLSRDAGFVRVPTGLDTENQPTNPTQNIKIYLPFVQK